MTRFDLPRGLLRWRYLFSFLAVLGFILLANAASQWLVDYLKMELTPRNEQLFHRLIMASAALYALLMAVPFVPGVEIGIGLLATVGAGIAGLVYACTVLGLSISFLVGRFMPEAWLRAALGFLHLHRMCGLLEGLEPLSRDERVALLVNQAPARAVAFLVRHRYLALAVALNLPGNAVIGGGGGITMLAGLSRLYSVPAFLATIMIAVAPVPLAVAVFGRHILG
jgi:hypothetical protein